MRLASIEAVADIPEPIGHVRAKFWSEAKGYTIIWSVHVGVIGIWRKDKPADGVTIVPIAQVLSMKPVDQAGLAMVFGEPTKPEAKAKAVA